MPSVEAWSIREFSEGLYTHGYLFDDLYFYSAPTLIFFCSFTSHLRSSCP